MLKVVGMISGTSYDAIEAVAAELSLDGETLIADLRAHTSTPYPAPVRDAIAAMMPPAATTLEQVCRVDAEIGRCFADAAQAVSEMGFGSAPDVVSSHGQTVFHWVEGPRAVSTLQIGQPAFIAARTGATVVHDLRIRDILAGGQGAPLASLLDVLLLNDGSDRVRGALNLGGIANVTVVGPDTEPIAYDTGPANALIDAAIEWRTDGREAFDAGGQRAAGGTVDEELLAGLLDEPYYRLDPPKSTGKELFHLEYIRAHLGSRDVATDDLLATLTVLSAEVVAAELRRFGVTEIVASGGGTRNPFLMAEITRRTPGATLAQVDEYGVAEAAKEALVMGIVGFLTVHGLPGTVPSCTGATRPVVLGSVVPGERPLRVAENAVAPVRMTVRTPLPQTATSRSGAA
jgi:anhydro-N-acetylmuramic acid kinase